MNGALEVHQATSTDRGTAVLIFARSPLIDARRKWLAAAGAGVSATAVLLAHTLAVARDAGQEVVLVTDREMTALAPPGVRTVPQRGAGFGARFRNAVADAFAAGFARVVVIGADVPGLTAGVLRDAVARLESGDNRSVVIGPSRDGGYYLIGFNQFDARAFEGIPWHTRAVLARTRHALGGKRLSYLAPLTDADDAGSLRRALAEVGDSVRGLRRALGRVLAALVNPPVRGATRAAAPRWTIALVPARRGPPPAFA